MAKLPADLKRLEADSIFILREVAAEFRNPVLLYSIGKDSSVLLHLLRKAFFPEVPPMRLLHVDTMWKFQEMIAFRDETMRQLGLELIVYTNNDGVEQGISPLVHGSDVHTRIMKTEALRQVLDHHAFDAAVGGARRDEERSRAKERIFSHRANGHVWDPKNQRPEFWQLYNTRLLPGETMRVFPLSDWTELDVWRYIAAESIPFVPLYLSAERPVITRNNMLIMVDDDRILLHRDEAVQMMRIRFRTLGCYPLTGAVRSEAATVEDIIQECIESNVSERHGRLIDHDNAASMEKKKREGYF